MYEIEINNDGMESFMISNHNKQQKINALLKAGQDKISKYFENPTKENIEHLFQKNLPARTYEGFLNTIKYFSAADLADRYVKHMTNSVTKGYGVFIFVTNLKKVLPKEMASLPSKPTKEVSRKTKEEKVEILDMNNAIEVLDIATKKEQKRTEEMNEVELFTDMFEGHKVRVLGTPDEPLFVATDVAITLGYQKPNNAINRHCKGATLKRGIIDSLGRTQEVRVIREPDVYRLAANSKLSSAQKFEEWIMDDVLPSIRKHGAYMTSEKIEDVLNDPDLIIGLATALKAEREKAREAELLIEQVKTKVEYHDEVLQSKYLITTTEISKDLGMSANDLNMLLNKKGLIYKQSNAWMPYSDFEWLISEGFADYHVTQWGQHFKWTERGRKMIYKIVKEDLSKQQIKALRNIEE